MPAGFRPAAKAPSPKCLTVPWRCAILGTVLGSTLLQAITPGERPGWFSDRSTVFYYASSSRAMAEQVAAYLKARTGQDFTVRRGAGLGVDPARKAYTLFVHYIKA